MIASSAAGSRTERKNCDDRPAHLTAVLNVGARSIIERAREGKLQSIAMGERDGEQARKWIPSTDLPVPYRHRLLAHLSKVMVAW